MHLQNALRVVIVDDQPAIRVDAEALLNKYHEFIVVGSCGSVHEALIVIRATKPDVLLLDIQLGDGTAFDILDLIDLENLKVIFITAYHEHAIKAIKIGALDYLLKPIDEQELKKALEKLLNAPPPQSEKITLAKQYFFDNSNRIAVSNHQRIQFVDINQIIYCHSDSGIITFYFSNTKKIVAARNIKHYEEQLQPPQFVRPHKSYIVNWNLIDHYDRIASSLIMQDGSKIPISARKKEFIIGLLTRKTQ